MQCKYPPTPGIYACYQMFTDLLYVAPRIAMLKLVDQN